MSQEVLVFVRLDDTNEPGEYIVPGVEVLRVQNHDVNVRIEAKKGEDKYQLTVQTVGRWVQKCQEVDVDEAKQLLHQYSNMELAAVKVGFKGAQLVGAIKVRGLEPTRHVNPPSPTAGSTRSHR